MHIETVTSCELEGHEYSNKITPILAQIYALEKSIQSDKKYISEVAKLTGVVEYFVQMAFDEGRNFETDSK